MKNKPTRESTAVSEVRKLPSIPKKNYSKQNTSSQLHLTTDNSRCESTIPLSRPSKYNDDTYSTRTRQDEMEDPPKKKIKTHSSRP
jgi:hypothetical protein